MIHQKYNACCGYCGEEIKLNAMQVDHIIPQSSFIWHLKNNYKIPFFLLHLKECDVNHIDNLMPACRVCNKWKSSFDLELFRNEISEQVVRLNNYSSNYRMAKRYDLVSECVKTVTFYFERVGVVLEGSGKKALLNNIC